MISPNTAGPQGISLSKILSPAFREVHRALKLREANQFVLKGGRGSAKSSFASVEVVLQLLKHPDIHAVVMRKIANTLRTTVFNQYIWAIGELGLTQQFKTKINPMEIIYLPTGQKIMFFGADDPGKLKSLKVPFGYVGILHFEELDQFSGEEEIRNIEQSVLRGGEIAIEFKVFNPPQTIMNWANKYVMREKPGQLIHHSDYRDVPEEWLGRRFLDDAEYLRQTNYRAYEHEYLGVPNGTGGNVFGNVSDLNMRQMVDIGGRSVPMYQTFDRLFNGLDWGYYPDPFAFNRVHFDAGRRDLYIYGELTLYRTGNADSAAAVRQAGVADTDLITCDSAEPKSIGDYKSYGLMARGAEKGPGSVDYSMKWLASLNHIYIDATACPDTWAEFTEYEYDRDREGNVVSGYPDRNNHHIDAVRYATEKIWKKRGQ
ncbi:MAG: phage terminase large subunit [Bacteroidales bacterium]|nr:phage terminase large subunit [Candidatus Equimonas faecalis]